MSTAVSRTAVAASLRLNVGEHGGIVTRAFTFKGRHLFKGDELSGEEVLSLPFQNKTALVSQGKLVLHTQGADEVAKAASEYAEEDAAFERDVAIDPTAGPFGAIVLKTFSHKGVSYAPGMRLTPEQFKAMGNRFVLIRQRKLAAFGEPVVENDLMG
jgi:hypothetical protein